jgi:hypothetical protein
LYYILFVVTEKNIKTPERPEIPLINDDELK